MEPNANENQTDCVTVDACEQKSQVESCGGDEFKLRRWPVSFAPGREWYPVGEFVALDATPAIDRAIEVFGAASDYRAEEIPWDAAPLPRRKPRNRWG
jgi:hypothetical protein